MTAPVPAGPTDAQGELREAIARAIFAAAHPIVEAFPDYWKRVAGGDSTRERYRCQADAVLALHTVRDALAAQEAVKRVEALFAGGPDTPCRTTWREDALQPECSAASVECVEVPLDDLRWALAGES